MPEPTCCACAGKAVARVLDDCFRKPVCENHRRLYADAGHLIDALPGASCKPSPVFRSSPATTEADDA